MQGQHGKGGQRQPPVHAQHDDDEEDQQEGVVDHGGDAGGEEVVQRVHVGGDARDQAADGAAVVEAHRQALQALEDFLAQVVHRFLADLLHDAHLQILKGEAQSQRGQVTAGTSSRGRERPRLAELRWCSAGTM